MTLFIIGIASSAVVGDLWERFLSQECPQSGTTEDIIHQVKTDILEDRRITVRQPDVKIGVGSVVKIMHDHLHTQKLSARWVHRLPTHTFPEAGRSPLFQGSFSHAPRKPELF